MKNLNYSTCFIYDHHQVWPLIAHHFTSLSTVSTTLNPDIATVVLISIKNKYDLFETTSLISTFARKCIVISFLDNDDNIQMILAQNLSYYLLSANSPSLELELSLAIASITNNFPLQIENWPISSTKLLSKHLYERRDLTQLLQQNLHALDFSDFFQSPIQYLDAIINELVTNAIFNAPRGPDHQPLYRHLPRQSNLRLREPEKVLLEIYSLNKNIMITVEDYFGGLEYGIIQSALGRAALARTPMTEGQGAGIGLFLVYRYSNLLVIENHPGRKTKIYAMIEATKKFKQYQGRITSFLYHFHLPPNLHLQQGALP